MFWLSGLLVNIASCFFLVVRCKGHGSNLWNWVKFSSWVIPLLKYLGCYNIFVGLLAVKQIAPLQFYSTISSSKYVPLWYCCRLLLSWYVGYCWWISTYLFVILNNLHYSKHDIIHNLYIGSTILLYLTVGQINCWRRNDVWERVMYSSLDLVLLL